MASHTPKRTTLLSIAIAALIYGAVLAGGMLWLWSNGEATVLQRLNDTPQTSVDLFEKETVADVPASWSEDNVQQEVPSEGQEDAGTETPSTETSEQVTEAQPEQQPAEEKPVEQVPAVDPVPAAEVTPPVTDTPEETVTEPSVTINQDAVPVTSLSTWKRFARPFDAKDTRPRIALVVTDLGLARNAAEAAVQSLPGEVTLAFSSLVPDLQDWFSKAKAAGHEILLTIPMEPVNYPQNDPGPNALLLTLEKKDNLDRMTRALARTDGYVGIIPYMGEKFVTQEDAMVPVMETVHEQGLAILDATMNNNSVIAPLARLGKIPFARATLRVDAAASGASVDSQLEQLEKTARENGAAIGVALPYPVTLERLKTWAATLEKKGLVLAPLSAVLTQSTVSPVQVVQ